jgi:hypothetical protein
MIGRRLTFASSVGFTLVELLLASLIALMLVGAVLGFASQAQHMFQVQPEQSDVQQRLRISVDALRRDLLMAGAGIYAGPATGPLNGFIAPVMPYRAFGDAADPIRGSFFRPDAISVVYVDSTFAQSTLSVSLPVGSLDAHITTMPNCPATTATQLCGFEAGTRVIVLGEDGRWDVFNVDQISAGVAVLQHRGASPLAYGAGAPIAAVKLATYYLKTDASGASQLFRYDGWASDLPVVDDVVALRFDYFGDGQPPTLTGTPLESEPGPWTTYGPKPPALGSTRGAWPAGENCAFMVVDGAQAPRQPALAARGSPLIELTPAELTDGPWCPDDAAANRFDADLLRVRRIRVTVQVQSVLASSRGPAGSLLTKGGATKRVGVSIPELQVQFDVAPRNLDLGR